MTDEFVYVLVRRYQHDPYYWQTEGNYSIIFHGVFKTLEEAYDAGHEYLEKKSPYIKKTDMRIFKVPLGSMCDYVSPYWDDNWDEEEGD